MPRIALDTPLFEVLGAKSLFLKRLERLGLRTVRDLLWHFPSRYEDFSKIYSIAELEPGQQATIQGVVEEVHESRSWRRQMAIVEATIADESGAIRAVWFNQPYVANVLKAGRKANFSGKVSLSEEGEVYLSHPAYEVLRGAMGRGAARAAEGADVDGGGARDGAETKHTARLVPVYPETRGLTSRGLRYLIQPVLKRLSPLAEWMPQATLAALGFPELDRAIRDIHFPNEPADAEAARRRFSFEDLFLLQIVNLEQKTKLAQEKAQALAADVEKIKRIVAALPFPLTLPQKRSLWEIVKDMERPRPMNRLLQGEVGSGKTVVAVIAAMVAAENGAQSAFMAPTEILARQHFETTEKLVAAMPPELRPTIGILTGGMPAGVRKEVAGRAADGGIAILFGTHALIQKSVAFKNLGLVIIDEQHRFGVRQRAELVRRQSRGAGSAGSAQPYSRGGNGAGQIPHFLSMSATPIPRTLMLTLFGDLDISLIDELPGGRRPIETKIVIPLARQTTYAFIKKEVRAGRQAFVICPRIEPAEENGNSAAGGGANPGVRRAAVTLAALDMRSVKEEYERLRTKVFPSLRLAMLHGQMKANEKDEIMQKFKAREYDILVATSVVEVGVDVPNATIMLIEGADRFGLAQLYQFRGRVGRGEHQSYCFLMAGSDARAANARLKAIMEARNGFELAEKDLALRGPGQFFGEVQTGLPDVAMEALQDPGLVKASREAAAAVVREDPQLKHYPLLRAKLAAFRRSIHPE